MSSCHKHRSLGTHRSELAAAASPASPDSVLSTGLHATLCVPGAGWGLMCVYRLRLLFPPY